MGNNDSLVGQEISRLFAPFEGCHLSRGIDSSERLERSSICGCATTRVPERRVRGGGGGEGVKSVRDAVVVTWGRRETHGRGKREGNTDTVVI